MEAEVFLRAQEELKKAEATTTTSNMSNLAQKDTHQAAGVSATAHNDGEGSEYVGSQNSIEYGIKTDKAGRSYVSGDGDTMRLASDE